VIVFAVLAWSIVSVSVPALAGAEGGTAVLISSAAWLFGLTLLAVVFSDDVRGI
jgi:hypothetical protein